MSEFGTLMKKILDERKLGHSRLSKMLSISRNHCIMLIKGERNPSPKMIKRIVEKLHLSEEIDTSLNLAVIKDKGYRI